MKISYYNKSTMTYSVADVNLLFNVPGFYATCQLIDFGSNVDLSDIDLLKYDASSQYPSLAMAVNQAIGVNDLTGSNVFLIGPPPLFWDARSFAFVGADQGVVKVDAQRRFVPFVPYVPPREETKNCPAAPTPGLPVGCKLLFVVRAVNISNDLDTVHQVVTKSREVSSNVTDEGLKIIEGEMFPPEDGWSIAAGFLKEVCA